MSHNHHQNQPSTHDEIPRIYVACLAAYKNGTLHGTWIDLVNTDPDAILAEVEAMLQASPVPNAEEWALHDYEGFAGVRLSEWEDFEQVHAMAQFIAQHGRLGAKLIAHVGDAELAQAVMSDGYAGCYDTLADFAQELTEDTIEIPEELRYYIDYERMARDMELNGEVFTIETAHDETHIFWNR